MHDVESKSGKYTLATFGLAASLMFLVASGAMNASYMYQRGAIIGHSTGLIYGSAGVAADIFMALAPFYFFAALRNREKVASLLAILLWLAVTAFSAQNAIGHLGSTRLDAASSRIVAATSYADTREDIKQARQALGFVPQHRPALTIKADIEKHKVSTLWIQSNECTQAAGKIVRAYCSTYQTLNSELGNAMEADKLTARIETLTAKSDKATAEHSNVVADADPQAKVISGLSNGRWDIGSIQSIVTMLGAFVFLLGAGTGPYVSLSVLRGESRRKIITLDAVEVPSLPLSADAKVPLGAPKKPAGGVLALQAPKVPRPEPSPEARALLAAIDFPLWPPSGDKRPEDSREHLAWRFLAWLTAHGLGGDYPAQRIDELYAEFAAADHRQPWEAMRVVKFELAKLKRYAWSSTPRHLHQRVQWTIRPPAIDKLMELLKKHGIAKAPPPTPKPKEDANRILPFALAAEPEPAATTVH